MTQPEFTPTQARLANLCITTKTLGKVTRREGNTPKTYHLVEVPRQLGVVDFATDDHEFALNLHRQPGGITKPLSPFYCNFRNLGSEVLETVGLVLAELPKPEGVKFCTGIPKAGNAIAEAYSRVTGLPYRELITKLGEGPEAKLVPHPEAIMGEGEGVLILDDLITGAHAKFAAGKAITELSYDVVGFV